MQQLDRLGCSSSVSRWLARGSQEYRTNLASRMHLSVTTRHCEVQVDVTGLSFSTEGSDWRCQVSNQVQRKNKQTIRLEDT